MIDIKNTNTSELLSQANEIFDQTRPFAELMMRYKCAMLEVKTKLDVLNTQLSLENDRNPFESIECRLKSVPSIIEKLNRKGLELSAESIEKISTMLQEYALYAPSRRIFIFWRRSFAHRMISVLSPARTT